MLFFGLVSHCMIFHATCMEFVTFACILSRRYCRIDYCFWSYTVFNCFEKYLEWIYIISWIVFTTKKNWGFIILTFQLCCIYVIGQITDMMWILSCQYDDTGHCLCIIYVLILTPGKKFIHLMGLRDWLVCQRSRERTWSTLPYRYQMRYVWYSLRTVLISENWDSTQ